MTEVQRLLDTLSAAGIVIVGNIKGRSQTRTLPRETVRGGRPDIRLTREKVVLDFGPRFAPIGKAMAVVADAPLVVADAALKEAPGPGPGG